MGKGSEKSQRQDDQNVCIYEQSFFRACSSGSQTLHGLVEQEKVNCCSLFFYLLESQYRSSNAKLPFVCVCKLRDLFPCQLAPPTAKPLSPMQQNQIEMSRVRRSGRAIRLSA